MNTETESPNRLDILEWENRQLRQAVDELAFLNTLVQQIGIQQSSSEIIETIVKQSVRRLHAEQGVVTLVERDESNPMKTLVRSMTSSVEQPKYHLHQVLLGWMQKHREPIRIEPSRGDSRFPGMRWDDSIRSLLAVPLLVKGEVTGVLALYNKVGDEGFSTEDMRLLAIIGTQSAQVIESARLYEEEETLRALRSEMHVAADIQRALLPRETPSIHGYDVAGLYVPAQVIGGDYFDYIPLPGGRWGIVVADVSGKGIPAAMFMTVCRTLMRTFVMHDAGPAACLSTLNSALCAVDTDGMFITVLFGILDPQAGVFTYSSGGHDLPIRVTRDGEVSSLPKTGGFVVGVMPNITFNERAESLEPGERLVLYTDGVTEAADAGGKMFGGTGLTTLLAASDGASAQETIRAIHQQVEAFSSTSFPRDDLTIVVIRRLSESRT